jgi:3-methyladenine DNA glycosylase AlkD
MSRPTPITVDGIVDEIQERLRAMPIRNTAAVRRLRREFSQRLIHTPPEMILAISDKLLDLSQFIYRFVAYELIAHHRPALRCLNSKHLQRLGRGLDSWGAVDCFACYLAGPAWREHRVPDALIHRWARSTDRWWRRAALVSTVPLNNKARGGKGDSQRTLDVCCRLITDGDDMVIKALSWALRELAKRDAKMVRAFVQENKNQLAARVVREVQNKLTTGLKNPHPGKQKKS